MWIPQSKSLGSAGPQAEEDFCAPIQHHTEIFAKVLTTEYMRHKTKCGKKWSNFVAVSVVDRA